MPEEAVSLDTAAIPDKLYFRIGEASRLLGVEPYVLRYWETEFPSLSPKKSDTGHRLYRRKDVEQLLLIKELLYAKRFTIEGARQTLATQTSAARNKDARDHKADGSPNFGRGSDFAQSSLFPESPLLPEIRRELAAILDLLR